MFVVVLMHGGPRIRSACARVHSHKQCWREVRHGSLLLIGALYHPQKFLETETSVDEY